MTLHPPRRHAADVPDVLRLVRGLADYERLLHEVVMTEADLHAALFGPQPRAHAVLAHADDSAVGLALWYYTFSTFTRPARHVPGRPVRRTRASRPAASASRCCATSRTARSRRIAGASSGAC